MIKIRITQEELTRMNSVRSFGPDLTLGKIGERMSRQYFEQIGASFIRESEDPEELKKFDFEILHNQELKKIENKTDTKIRPEMRLYSSVFGKEVTIPEYETGNIFIEFSSRKKDSGIVTTESDYWVNFFHHLNEIWIIGVNELRELITNNDFKIFYDAGDKDSETHGYLIPRFIFREHFKVIQYERVVI